MKAIQLAQSGAVWTYENGKLITLREMLSRERGCKVSDAEAVELASQQHRKAMIAKFIKYARSKK